MARSRSKVGVMREEDFEFDLPHDPSVERYYSDEYLREREALAQAVQRKTLTKAKKRARAEVKRYRGAAASSEEDTEKAFDPNQPRDESGKWSDEGGGDGGEEALEETLSVYMGDNVYNPSHALGLNHALRSGSDLTPDQQTALEVLTGAVKGAPRLKQDIVLYRGAESDFVGTSASGLVRDRGFVSTSRRFDIAEQFTSGEVGSVVYRIRVSKGARVLDLAGRTPEGLQVQDEVLLPSGSYFRRGGQTQRGGVTVVDLDYLGNGERWAIK